MAVSYFVMNNTSLVVENEAVDSANFGLLYSQQKAKLFIDHKAKGGT